MIIQTKKWTEKCVIGQTENNFDKLITLMASIIAYTVSYKFFFQVFKNSRLDSCKESAIFFSFFAMLYVYDMQNKSWFEKTN